MPGQGFPNNVLQDATGNTPVVSDNLEVENRTISSIDQAFSVCETLVNDWKKGILFSARITAKLQGERPYNQKRLESAGKGWKTNISTGFLATECSKITPRLYMPIKTAKYLTAAELPADYPNGTEKTQHFRQVITDTIRSWPKFNFYIRGLAREVGTFGFGMNAWLDEHEWRPTFFRMDKGFVPQGTEVMEEPQFFMAKWDYSPNELLTLLKNSIEIGASYWKKDNVVQAINGAIPPPVDATYPNARTYEELIRQATWGYAYTKGVKKVRTYHLFSKETTGKVSHYVLLADTGPVSSQAAGSPYQASRLLYENLDQFDSMNDVANATVFDYGDGTIHGSWGAAQILYDLAAQVEKIRCDSVDNLRNSNKMKLQVAEAKNINDVKLTVNDVYMIVSGAQFAGNQAALPQDVSGYEELDQKLTQIAQQKIGAFIPPIPTQASDIKAAQINAAMAKEKEIQEAMLENWLIQWAQTVATISKRLCTKDNPDEVAKETYQKLLQKLNEDEIKLLSEQFPVKSVMDFTEYKAQQRAAFASSVMNNPLFRQSEAARTMAEGVGDETFVRAIVLPDGDNTEQLAATRQQLLENAAMAIGQPVPILPSDNDWVHMQTLKPNINQLLMAPQTNVNLVQIALQHYAGHWEQGVAKKTIPNQAINDEKSWIASAEKALNAHKEQQAIQQQTQQAQQSADAHAQELVKQHSINVAKGSPTPSVLEQLSAQKTQQQPPQAQQ